MKKILYVILIAVCLWIIGCEATTINLRDWQVGLEIDSVSFQGDWSAYKTNGVDNLRICMNLEDTSNTPIKLKLPINYIGNQPSVSVSDDKYVLDGNGDWNDSSTLIIESEFKRSNNMDLSPDLIGTDSKSLNNEYYYKLNLKYNADNNSVLDIDIVGKNWNLIPNGLNFNVNYKVVHDATADGGKLNLIVMAEGYRADQMDDYKTYVEDAFKDANSFNGSYITGNTHTHYINDFYSRHWNQIRVIRMDTISPQEGVDKHWYQDDVHTILNFNREGVWQLCDFTRIKSIMEETKPCGLSYNQADAYIILVNDETVWAYSLTHWIEIGYKYGQPIHPVIIQAPVGYDVNAADFHPTNKYKIGAAGETGVTTNAIAHELGHALARLQDEYDTNSGGLYIYLSSYRNVDNSKTNPKWQKLIDAGYGGNNTSDYLIETVQGAFYNSYLYYRPTHKCRMRHSSQFCPVCTYHFEATFKIRTSLTDPHIADLTGDENPNNYEWSHYTIENFYEDVSPDVFARM